MSGVTTPASGAQDSEDFEGEGARSKTEGAAISKGSAGSDPYGDDDFESSGEQDARAADAPRERPGVPRSAAGAEAAPAAAGGGGAGEAAAPCAAAPPTTGAAGPAPAAAAAPEAAAAGPSEERLGQRGAAGGASAAPVLAPLAGPAAPPSSGAAEGGVPAGAPAPEREAENAFSVSGVKGPLHVAAKGGSASTVRFLLKNRADPADVDASGQTALQVAEASGHAEVCCILREALRIPPEEAAAAPEAQRAEAGAPAEAAPRGPAAEASGPAAPGGGAAAERGQEAEPPTSCGERPVVPRQIRTAPARDAARSGASRGPSSPSQSFLGDRDLKRIASTLSHVTTDGVKKGATYMGSLSGCRSSPKYTIGGLPRNSPMTRSSSTPAPGTYDGISRSGELKYAQQPTFSFGRGPSRFGTSPSLSRCQPGPGTYNPKDPARSVSLKVGFGNSMKLRSPAVVKEHPGPGAYEIRSTMGEGRACRARGRFVAQQLSTAANPGPGTYSPSTYFTLAAGPKTGFGTSRRGGGTRLAELAPGPGTYDMQNAKSLGSDAPKFSVISRRRQLDIESYLTPGPGSYNAHTTCFGGP